MKKFYMLVGLFAILLTMNTLLVYSLRNRGYKTVSSGPKEFEGWMMKAEMKDLFTLTLKEKTYWDFSPVVSHFEGTWVNSREFKGRVFNLTHNKDSIIITYFLNDGEKVIVYK